MKTAEFSEGNKTDLGWLTLHLPGLSAHAVFQCNASYHGKVVLVLGVVSFQSSIHTWIL